MIGNRSVSRSPANQSRMDARLVYAEWAQVDPTEIYGRPGVQLRTKESAKCINLTLLLVLFLDIDNEGPVYICRFWIPNSPAIVTKHITCVWVQFSFNGTQARC